MDDNRDDDFVDVDGVGDVVDEDVVGDDEKEECVTGA